MTFDVVGTIGAVGAFITTLVMLGMKYVDWKDARAARLAQMQRDLDTTRREEKIDALTTSVNGIHAKAVDMAYRAGIAEGQNGNAKGT